MGLSTITNLGLTFFARVKQCLKIHLNLIVMPVQRPFNEHVLWQGRIQRSNYSSPQAKPLMILPEINNITGGTIKDPTAPQIWKEITQSYNNYSTSYWSRVKDSHKTYRIQQTKYPNLPSSPSSFSPYQRKQDSTPLTQKLRQTPHVFLEELEASRLNRFS